MQQANQPAPGDWYDEIVRLDQWLQSDAPENVLMPLVMKKPMHKHAKGKWGRADFLKLKRCDFAEPPSVGILLKTLICIDIDSHGVVAHLRSKFPEWFNQAICVVTTKGMHLIFLRTPYCEGLTDKAQALKSAAIDACYLDKNGEVPTDLKTITSTGTAGVLVVQPSPGKRWETAPWDTKLNPIPDNLVCWWRSHCKASSTPSPNHRGTCCQPLYHGDRPHGELDVAVAVAICYQILEARGDCSSYWHAQEGNGLYFMTGNEDRICPSGIVHDSNNFKLYFEDDGGIWYGCFGGKCQRHQVGRWREEIWERSFDEDHYSELARPYHEEMQKKAEDRNHEMLASITSQLIKYMNHYFIVVKSSKPEVMELRYDSTGLRVVNFERRSFPVHKHVYKLPYMHKWLDSPKRRKVARLIFKFNQAEVRDDEFNMFLGLRIEKENAAELLLPTYPTNMARVTPFLDLLHDVWAGGCNETYEYILNWLAYPLQTRHKTRVCLVVISDQGYGKGTVADELIGKGIYGEGMDGQSGAYSYITDIDDIVGRFDTMSCNRVFINADECSSFGGAYKQNNKFKCLHHSCRHTQVGGQGTGWHQLRELLQLPHDHQFSRSSACGAFG